MKKYCLYLAVIFFIAACKDQQQTLPIEQKKETKPYSREELKKRTFDYFWKTTDTLNYQVPDRYPTLTFSSIAATGFGLSSYLVGIENNYITREQGADRVLKTLEVLWNLPQG